MDSNTIRCLNLPGGGKRGIISNTMLKHLKPAGMTWDEYFSIFDALSGASAGAILICGYGIGLTPEDLDDFFLTKGGRVFSIDSNYNTRPSILSTGWDLVLAKDHYTSPDDYSSLPDEQKYGHLLLKDILTEIFGTKTLADLKYNVVIPAEAIDITRLVFFSNISCEPFFTNNNEKIVDVLLATSAAPTYLPSHTFGGHEYQDGGVMCNNPIQQCIMRAKLMKPFAQNIVAVSAGTGADYLSYLNRDSVSESGVGLLRLVDIAKSGMAGAEQNAMWCMNMQNFISNSMFTPNSYFNFLDCNFPNTSAMDDFSPASMQALISQTNAYMSTQGVNIQNMHSHLIA